MPTHEPLAIVGMACRFPGGANDPSSFWELLRNGVDAITEVPEERWNVSRFHHTNAGAPGRMVTRWGGFVGNVDMFDAAFFGIAPREAACMDPQHRWLLETTWEAIEDAGLAPEQLAGSRTGVFVGISHSDYPSLQRRDTASIDGYTNIGSARELKKLRRHLPDVPIMALTATATKRVRDPARLQGIPTWFIRLPSQNRSQATRIALCLLCERTRRVCRF